MPDEPVEFKPLATGRGGCYASHHVTDDGLPVGYMYREPPDFRVDSGWRFFSGLETPEYTENPDNFGIYDVNTVANYDPAIIPYLDAPLGTAFGRREGTDEFDREAFEPSED